MAEGEEGRKPPLPAHAAHESPSPAEGGGAELRIHPNKNRIVQVAKTGGRKLFDAARRELFLEWFAATCNVTLSAARAEVNCCTVFRHRMKDEAFAAAWDTALAQGYARIEARLLQEAAGPLPHSLSGEWSPSPANAGEDEEPFNAQLALQLLREHARRAGAGGRQKTQRTAARAASNKEIAEALAKRLKGFALRVQKVAPPPPSGRSPSPANAGEDE